MADTIRINKTGDQFDIDLINLCANSKKQETNKMFFLRVTSSEHNGNSQFVCN